MTIFPTAIHLDACSICQLECPLCVTAESASIIGRGSLTVEDFKRLIDHNPWIREIGFANKGEIFLNNELVQMLQYAREKDISLDIDHGVNLNHAGEEALEALVKYQVISLRVSIDGITQETYQIYRVGGNLKRVIDNIRKINRYKVKYRSAKPCLVFQFIPFGHNDHEMEGARLLARMLNMEISFHLNRVPDFFPVQDKDMVRRYAGHADRREYLAGKGKSYMRHKCNQMWSMPHIGWDGKLFGCSSNIWGVYADNVFDEHLVSCINNEKMQYARDMLMGRKPPRTDIPCLNCFIYQDMLEYGNWITEGEIHSGDQAVKKRMRMP